MSQIRSIWDQWFNRTIVWEYSDVDDNILGGRNARVTIISYLIPFNEEMPTDTIQFGVMCKNEVIRMRTEGNWDLQKHCILSKV